jgi:hypothetical protein
MLIISLFTLVFGVYSPVYGNGQAFLFFLAMFNLYIWALLYLNWPMGWEGDFSQTGASSQRFGRSGQLSAKRQQEIEMQQVRDISDTHQDITASEAKVNVLDNVESDMSHIHDVNQLGEVLPQRYEEFKNQNFTEDDE